MMFPLVILSATFLAALWLAVDLMRPADGMRSRRRSGEGDAVAAAELYEPMRRLMDESDFHYVSDQGDLAERLRLARRTAMRLYLQQVRRDFLEVWGVCRLLAPISPDPALVSRLSRQYWSFHRAYLSVYAQFALPALVRKPAAADQLVRALADIREQAQSLLAVSHSALSAPAAA
jgi:hypothetical protein